MVWADSCIVLGWFRMIWDVICMVRICLELILDGFGMVWDYLPTPELAEGISAC